MLVQTHAAGDTIHDHAEALRRHIACSFGIICLISIQRTLGRTAGESTRSGEHRIGHHFERATLLLDHVSSRAASTAKRINSLDKY
jgi:hypothetical protein